MGDVMSIRASEEMQARFKDFAETGSFRNQSELFSHLLTLYAAQETGFRTPTLEGAINAVSELTDRITKVLIGAGEVVFTNQEKEKAQIEALQQEANAKIEANKQEAEKKITSLSSENESLKAASEEQKRIIDAVQYELAEAREHEKRLEQILDDKAALIDGYREKIDGLESEISRQKVIVTDATDAMAELDTLRLKTKEQDLQIEHMTLEKEKALIEQKSLFTEKMSVTVSEYEATIRSLELDVGQAKNLNDKALIDLEMRLRKEMGEQQTAYSKDLKEYESRILALLKELENLKVKEAKAPDKALGVK